MPLRVFVLVLLTCGLGAFASEVPSASARRLSEPAIPATSNQPAALDLLSGFRGAPMAIPSVPLKSKDPKLESHLAELAISQLGAVAIGPPELPPDIESMIGTRLMRLDVGERVQVYVTSNTDLEAAGQAIQDVGGTVQRQNEASGIVQALVAISQLRSLSADPLVKFVSLPDYGVTQAGSKKTEGDSILKANLARTDHGIDGSGVRVGVISGGDAGLAQSQASGDLPSVNESCDSVSSSDAEGTAMMEIVHDIAPGAQLWFAGSATSLDFNAAVDCLTANTDVVVDDVGFFNVGPYDGTNVVSANTSADYNDSGNPVRSYITAVANEADKHWAEPYSACQSTILQTFQATSDTADQAGIGPQCFDPVLLAPGESFVAFLTWNDPWGSSCNDYDIALFDHATAIPLAASVNPQTCSQDPSEELAWTNPLSTNELVDIFIDNSNGLAATRDLELFTHGGDLLNFDTPSSSVPAESDAGGGVVSVGAINASDPGNNDIEVYSSLGPTNDNRTKPDIAGIDCVSVTGDGGFDVPFCGTSAAAPHIAGIAALLLQCKPSLKAGELGDNPAADRNALRSGLLTDAVDLGSPGTDNIYGAGRADAQASANSICSAATPTPTPTHSPTPTPTHSPTPTPTQSPQGWLQGDANCSGGIDIGDVTTILKKADGLVVPAGCPSYQDNVNCDAAIADALDALDVLLNLAHTGALPAPSGCAAIGSPLLV